MRSLSELAANGQADYVGKLLSGGYLRIYAGAQPDADTPASGTLLAELRFGSFSAAAAGRTQTTVTPDRDARADGTASYYTALTKNGTQVLVGSVGTGDRADLRLGSVEVRRGAEVHIDDFVYRVPKG